MNRFVVIWVAGMLSCVGVASAGAEIEPYQAPLDGQVEEDGPYAPDTQVLPEDAAVPDLVQTDEDYDLFLEDDVNGAEPVQLIPGLLEPDPNARSTVPTGPYIWYLFGQPDRQGAAGIFTDQKLAAVRNRPGSFVVGYATATGEGRQAARFDVQRVKPPGGSYGWYGGRTHGDLASCGWLQGGKVADRTVTTTSSSRACRDAELNRAPRSFAALVNCDACNGPQGLGRRGRPEGSPSFSFAPAYRNVEPWKTGGQRSLQFKAPWATGPDVGWRYITRDWRHIALSAPGGPKGFNLAFVPLEKFVALPENWAALSKRDRQETICSMMGRQNRSVKAVRPVQNSHRNVWPRVCDVTTPPAGVTEPRCERLRNFSWKSGECVYIKGSGSSVGVPVEMRPPALVDCLAGGGGQNCRVDVGEWSGADSVLVVKAECSTDLTVPCDGGAQDTSIGRDTSSAGGGCWTEWGVATVVARNAAGEVRRPMRTASDLVCVH